MISITERIKKERIYFDGGFGSLLQARGIKPGEPSENWSLTHPEEIISIHREYFEAGADVATTNTFGVNGLKYSDEEIDEFVRASVECAKKAAEGFEDRYIAYDLGPTGKLIRPMGSLDFEDAVKAYVPCVKAAEKYGADLVIIETMNDSMETKAAVMAVKENSSLPFIVSNAYDERQKLMTGADPEAMAALAQSLGAAAVGMNCSFGPDRMIPVLKRMVKVTSIPVIVMPNAGLPKIEDGKTVYDITADEFADIMAEIAGEGAGILGGCCGTTPEYIKRTIEKTRDIPYSYPEYKGICMVSSYSNAVVFGEGHVLIGERINPTGKKKIKEALTAGDYTYILQEGLRQEEKGVHILDVNAGLPSIDEKKALTELIYELQSVTSLPLQIDTKDFDAMESAMRIYNGKPLVNSVTGEQESMDKVFPLVKKYGGAVIALTIDDDGIPETAEGRMKVAEKIVNEALKYGIHSSDIIVDPLAMTISSDSMSAQVTLDAIRLIHDKLGLCTSLGVSNISFGLPQRNIINSTFYAMALQTGLSAAIMNPFSDEMMNVYHAFNALSGRDKGCVSYIDYTSDKSEVKKEDKKEDITLSYAIEKGLAAEAQSIAQAMTADHEVMDIINGHVIPALNHAGDLFEEKKMFLPQLIMTAEAAGKAFEVLKSHMPKDFTDESRKIILATVKGDIHDIGKNIVKAMLESYGFYVQDLGRDVDPDIIVEAADGCRLVGLSALMTTTVPAMEETIKKLKARYEDIKIVVGGAVLTEDYSKEIGADYYGGDAMDTVRAAQEVLG